MLTALIIIDVQRGLFDPTPRPFEADLVVARINALSSRARAAQAPVVIVQHEGENSPLAFRSPGWELEEALVHTLSDHRVRKSTPDAFLGTELEDLLRGLHVSHLVVCGYASEFCVDTTTRRAAALGFAVTLAADAHTTHDKDHAPASLLRTHENVTLPAITSFGPVIRAMPSERIEFSSR